MKSNEIAWIQYHPSTWTQNRRKILSHWRWVHALLHLQSHSWMYTSCYTNITLCDSWSQRDKRIVLMHIYCCSSTCPKRRWSHFQRCTVASLTNWEWIHLEDSKPKKRYTRKKRGDCRRICIFVLRDCTISLPPSSSFHSCRTLCFWKLRVLIGC